MYFQILVSIVFLHPHSQWGTAGRCLPAMIGDRSKLHVETLDALVSHGLGRIDIMASTQTHAYNTHKMVDAATCGKFF